MKEKRIIWLSVLFAFLCVDCFAAEDVRFVSKANGYSITLPAKWVKLPDAVLQATFDAAFSNNTKQILKWEAAFQIAPQTDRLRYPYVIAQVMKYTDSGLDGQPSYSQMKAIVKSIGGAEVKELTDEISSEVQDLMSDTQLGEALLDVENKNYLMPLEMQVAGIGKIKGQIKGYFGKKAMIQVMFYDHKSNWENSAQDRSAVLNSLIFDPSAAYDITLKKKTNLFRRFGMSGLVGAICGAAAVLFSTIKKRLR